MLKQIKVGYRRKDLAREKTRTKHIALPAKFAYRAQQRVIKVKRWTSLVQGDTSVVAGFQLMARPSTIVAIHSSDITIYKNRVSIVVQLYKGDDQGFHPAGIVRLPLLGKDDEYRLFWNVLKKRRQMLLKKARYIPQAVTRAVHLANIQTPPGYAYKEKSLRSCGISAANALQVQMPEIMAVSGYTSWSTVQKHYLYVSIRAC